MDEPIQNPESPSPPTPEGEPVFVTASLPWHDADGVVRRALLRRLRLLLVAGLALFTLAVWVLVGVDDPLERLGLVSGPKHVVRAHLAALSRGEARTAYEFFSNQYREQIPWPAYERMITSHRDMFRTHVVGFRDREGGDDASTELDTELLSANGRRYLVRFTVVQAAGRWWIDRVRWSLAPDPDRYLHA